jgi:hypothetical protein
MQGVIQTPAADLADSASNPIHPLSKEVLEQATNRSSGRTGVCYRCVKGLGISLHKVQPHHLTHGGLEFFAGFLCVALIANTIYLAGNVVQLHSARTSPAVSPTQEVLGDTLDYPPQTTLEFIGVHSFFKFSRSAAQYSFLECVANMTHVCDRPVACAAQLYLSYPESPNGGLLTLEERSALNYPPVHWGCLTNSSGGLLMCGTASQNRLDYTALAANLTDGTLLLHFSPKDIKEGVAVDHHSQQLMQIAVADVSGSGRCAS